jgi:hypothetical protein
MQALQIGIELCHEAGRLMLTPEKDRSCFWCERETTNKAALVLLFKWYWIYVKVVTFLVQGPRANWIVELSSHLVWQS